MKAVIPVKVFDMSTMNFYLRDFGCFLRTKKIEETYIKGMLF